MSPSIFSLYQDPTADSLKGPCSSVYVGLSERQLCDSTPSSTLHSTCNGLLLNTHQQTQHQSQWSHPPQRSPLYRDLEVPRQIWNVNTSYQDTSLNKLICSHNILMLKYFILSMSKMFLHNFSHRNSRKEVYWALLLLVKIAELLIYLVGKSVEMLPSWMPRTQLGLKMVV